jgi:hypothetical protein
MISSLPPGMAVPLTSLYLHATSLSGPDLKIVNLSQFRLPARIINYVTEVVPSARVAVSHPITHHVSNPAGHHHGRQHSISRRSQCHNVSVGALAHAVSLTESGGVTTYLCSAIMQCAHHLLAHARPHPEPHAHTHTRTHTHREKVNVAIAEGETEALDLCAAWCVRYE